jgi:diguanylate cyclase (GGDEF)-like protein
VKLQCTENRQSPYAEQLRRGFHSLSFSEPLEEEFRKFYSHAGISRARLMPSFAIMMTLVAMGIRMANGGPQLLMNIWDLGFFLPLLVATLYLSTLPEHYKTYQSLLAITGLTSGLVVSSMYFRPNIGGMPSYFAMEVAWIFAVWLIISIRFRRAAAVALMISGAHIFGILSQNLELRVIGYESMMLVLVTGIGAISCYQLELATRRSFLESKELGELNKELEVLAQLDGLTGLNNRRSYDIFVERIWGQCKRDQVSLTLLLIDLDHFKAFNDHYGHQTGDDALKAVAGVIKSSAKRPFDFAARYGGEEFIIALYGTPEIYGGNAATDASRALAESLRTGIQKLKIPHEKSSTGKYLTASIGVAVILPEAERSLPGALQMADEALYRAKEDGRNRVSVTESGTALVKTGRFRASDRKTA